MKKIKLRFDLYLSLLFALILVVFKEPQYAYICIIPFLLISYYRIFLKLDITTAIILMLSSRLIMGPLVPNSDLAFNILNILCNYLPISFLIFIAYIKSDKLNKKRLFFLKWTIVYVAFLLIFGLLHITYTISVFAQEILPLLLFILLATKQPLFNIHFNYLLKFFRYTFIACIIIYVSPHFASQFWHLFSDAIVFKESVYPAPFFVNKGNIPRNMGFVFDFRILGQLGSIYLIILYYLKKDHNYLDIILLVTVTVLTFSRGPILIVLMLLFAIYLPAKIKVTKRILIALGVGFAVLISVIVFSFSNPIISKYISTFNPFAEKSAISQRGAFLQYSLQKFYENPLGNGIGSLSSPNAGNVIHAGFTNFHKKVPDPVIYYQVSDAYWVMSLAEKGIFGFILLLLSLIEIFYSNKNRLSLFFMIGLFINMIGTDVPKEGFFYFVIIYIYFELSQRSKLQNSDIELSIN